MAQGGERTAGSLMPSLGETPKKDGGRIEMVPTGVLVACPVCGLTQRSTRRRQRRVRSACAARLSLAASQSPRQPAPHGGARPGGAVLYVPANIYPILLMYCYGAYSEARFGTVW